MCDSKREGEILSMTDYVNCPYTKYPQYTLIHGQDADQTLHINMDGTVLWKGKHYELMSHEMVREGLVKFSYMEIWSTKDDSFFLLEWCKVQKILSLWEGVEKDD